MNTKTCSKCGWVYPADWPGRTCRFCHTPFVGGYCSRCGEWADRLQPGEWACKKCITAEHRANINKHRRTADERFDEWLRKIKALPEPYKTLTEEQWMQACKHFGGCAYCGSASIDARSMFIPFKYGGRYCAWNIVPACELCETAIKATENPFIRMDSVVNRCKNGSAAKRRNQSLKTLEGIVDYLQQFMEDKNDTP